MKKRKKMKKDSPLYKMKNKFKKWKSSSFEESKKEFFQKSTFSMFEVLILLLIAILFGILIGYIITYHRNPLDKNVSEIVSTYRNILDGYYGKIDANQLSDAAVKGMIDSLKDPYSSYMNEQSTSSFQENIDGSFVGIGVTVLFDEDGYHHIIAVNEDGPAEKAGILVDDIITVVDGKSVHDVSGEEFTKLIRGKKGSTVQITVKRGEEEKTFAVKRDIIEIPSVSNTVIGTDDQKVGYIHIESFASNTYSQFAKALKRLEKKKIQYLVIDVRDNPGGYLLQTQEILSLFFPKKTLLYQIESKNVKKKVVSLSKESRDYPVAVLINGGSASASEILASCFQDNYKNSIVVGTKSYGKGTVQKAQYLSNGTSIKYTTQKWLTSKGKWLDGKGVTPNIVIEQAAEYYDNPTYKTDLQLQEAIKKLKES